MVKLRTLPARVGMLAPRLKTMQPGSWRSSTDTSAQRGYGYRWQKARAGYLERHPFCVYCLRDAGISADTIEGVIHACTDADPPLPYAQVVDHRIPHRGDMALFWDRNNWQSLCSTHHSGEKQCEETNRA